MSDSLTSWTGRVLLQIMGAPAPISIDELAHHSGADLPTLDAELRTFVQRGYLTRTAKGYIITPAKRSHLAATADRELPALLKGSRLLFAPGAAPTDADLRKRIHFLCQAELAGKRGTLWLSRSPADRLTGDTVGLVTITLPGRPSPIPLRGCPVLKTAATTDPLRSPVPPGQIVVKGVVGGMIQAIDNELPFAREDQTRIQATQGTFHAIAGKQYVYRFQIERFDRSGEARPALPDDAPIQVQVRGLALKGVLVGQSAGEILIAFDTDLGRGSIGAATVISSPADLLEAMRTAIVARHQSGRPPAMAVAAFNLLPPEVRRLPLDQLPIDVGTLNPEQQEAVALALASPVGFIWGPPGTGKTYTLGKIVHGLCQQGKRVLLLSHTNVAVDTLLLSAVKQLDGSPAVAQGRVMRFGLPQKEELKRETAVLPEQIAERLNPSVVQNRARLERRRKELDELISKAQAEPESPLRTHQLEHLHKQTQDVAAQLHAIRERLVKLGEELLVQARVVACTLTKAYMSSLLTSQEFDVVIIDEASMAPLPALWLAAHLAKSQVLLVGDFRQLGPIAQAETKDAERWLRRDIFAAAGIETAVNEGRPDERLVMLKEQRRMHPAIAAAPSKLLYQSGLRNHHGPDHFADRVDVRPVPGNAVALVDTSRLLPWNYFTESGSRFNLHSALLCIRLAAQALADGTNSIGIITPFAGQARLLRRLIRDQGWSSDQITAATVHRFQGDEKDLILFDSVVDLPSRRLGRLLEGDQESQAMRLMNVAWTRARAKFLFVGNIPHLKSSLQKGSGMGDFFWEAFRSGEHNGSAELFPEVHRPDDYRDAFLTDLVTAKKIVVQVATLDDNLTFALYRARERGAEATLVVGSYSSVLDDLQRVGVRIGVNHDATCLAWLDDRIVWFGRDGEAGKGGYFRQEWPATAADLWNLTNLDQVLAGATSTTTRIAQRIGWREAPRCEACEGRMRVRCGEYGFYWVCPCRTKPLTKPVREAVVNLAAAEAGVTCPKDGGPLVVNDFRGTLVCRICKSRRRLGQ